MIGRMRRVVTFHNPFVGLTLRPVICALNPDLGR
jgi:hypothetical protein